MKLSYEKRVKIFKRCITKTETARSAIMLAHRKHGLNAADSAGGITSDQSAWRDAVDSLGIDLRLYDV